MAADPPDKGARVGAVNEEQLERVGCYSDELELEEGGELMSGLI